jgi:hypothetical protein
MSTTREVAERIAETLFRDGSHRAADRLLLIRGESHAGAAVVSNAEYLGGFSKAAVVSLVATTMTLTTEQLTVEQTIGIDNPMILCYTVSVQ